MKKNIGIVYGGYSSEYKISIKSGEFIFKILNNNPDWNVYKVLLSKNSTSVILLDDTMEEVNHDDFSFKHGDNRVTFDAIYNIIHGSPGETGEFSSRAARNSSSSKSNSSTLLDTLKVF